jgi:hypothetical protein
MPLPQTIQVEWIPLNSYAGANHVLGAGVACVAPGTGNIYFWDCVQWDGPKQDLNIYRLVAKTQAWEHVVTFEGTKDAERGFERGQVWIGQGGALIVATTMIPKGVPYVTRTGFQGVRCRIPGVDEPWGDVGLAGRFTAIEQRLALIEDVLGNLASTGGLDAKQTEALNRLVELCGL